MSLAVRRPGAGPQEHLPLMDNWMRVGKLVVYILSKKKESTAGIFSH